MSEFENEKYAEQESLSVRKIRKTSSRKEVGADFVLPDYMGDVKRVLKYTAHVIPCNQLVLDGEVSCLANVTFRVLYLDSEDMLTEASFSSDVEFSDKIVGASQDVDIDYKTPSVSIRLGGPRKMSAKATVSCEMSIVEDNDVCARADYQGAETLKREVKIHTEEYLKAVEREYAEEIDKIEETTSDEIEIVKSFAEAFIDGVHNTDGGVNLSGYIDAFCILRTDEGLIRLEKQIPVEEHIECERYDNSAFIPKAYVTGVNVNLNNVTDDDRCFVSAVMNMTVECCLTHHYNKSITVVTDAFFEGCKNDCCYEELEFSTLCDTVFDKAVLSATLNRAEEPLRDIIESDMCIKNLRYEMSGNDVTVLCDAEMTIIARGNEREDCYAIKEKTEFSKRYKLNTKDLDKIVVSVIPCTVSVSFDAEKIYIDAPMLISVISENKESVEILSDLRAEKGCEASERSVIVYYPEKDDTLWSVSKKYSVPLSNIIMKNEIHNNSIDGLKKVIIIK